MTLAQAIQNGPNRRARVLGQATLEGETVNVRVAICGMFSHARAEYRGTTQYAIAWHPLGGNYSLAMPFENFLRSIPYIANLNLMSDIQEELEQCV